MWETVPIYNRKVKYVTFTPSGRIRFSIALASTKEIKEATHVQVFMGTGKNKNEFAIKPVVKEEENSKILTKTKEMTGFSCKTFLDQLDTYNGKIKVEWDEKEKFFRGCLKNRMYLKKEKVK